MGSRPKGRAPRRVHADAEPSGECRTAMDGEAIGEHEARRVRSRAKCAGLSELWEAALRATGGHEARGASTPTGCTQTQNRAAAAER